MGVIPFSVPKTAQKAGDMGLIPAGTPKTARKVGDRGQKGPWSYLGYMHSFQCTYANFWHHFKKQNFGCFLGTILIINNKKLILSHYTRQSKILH